MEKLLLQHSVCKKKRKLEKKRLKYSPSVCWSKNGGFFIQIIVINNRITLQVSTESFSQQAIPKKIIIHADSGEFA